MPSSASRRIVIGTSGFSASHEECFRNLDGVEVQKTFYSLPRRDTALRWRRLAPPGFVFTAKAWQVITHPPSSPTYRRMPFPPPPGAGFFRSPEAEAAWEKTLEILAALEAEVAVFQCPSSFTPTREHVEDMRAFFRKARRSGITLAWEPRGDWPWEEVESLSLELGLVPVLDPFREKEVLSWREKRGRERLFYFRLHGRGGYRYRYSREEKENLRGLVLDLASSDRVYCFFNNVYMWDDAREFREMLGLTLALPPGG